MKFCVHFTLYSTWQNTPNRKLVSNYKYFVQKLNKPNSKNEFNASQCKYIMREEWTRVYGRAETFFLRA